MIDIIFLIFTWFTHTMNEYFLNLHPRKIKEFSIQFARVKWINFNWLLYNYLCLLKLVSKYYYLIHYKEKLIWNIYKYAIDKIQDVYIKYDVFINIFFLLLFDNKSHLGLCIVNCLPISTLCQKLINFIADIHKYCRNKSTIKI